MSACSQALMSSSKWIRLMRRDGWKIESRSIGGRLPTPCMVKGGAAFPVPNGAVSRDLISILKMKFRPRRK